MHEEERIEEERIEEERMGCCMREEGGRAGRSASRAQSGERARHLPEGRVDKAAVERGLEPLMCFMLLASARAVSGVGEAAIVRHEEELGIPGLEDAPS